MPPLILASKSAHRAQLLTSLGLPFTVQAAHIDETPLPNESPRAYVSRVARSKAEKIATENPGSVVLAADTPVIVGRRMLQTPQTQEEAATMLRQQSGRRVHVPTVVVVVNAQGTLRSIYVDSWLKFKQLSEAEIAAYLATPSHWQYASGALQIENYACEPFIQTMHGSFSGIIGLPLYETRKLLAWAGVGA